MNIVNKLTLRHLLLNKRRTLVTIFGVIISVAMITAVATISTSFMNLLQRQAMASDGEWHVQYQNVNRAQLEAIRLDDASKEVIISRDTGYAEFEGGQNSYKPYLFIKEYNTVGFDHFPIELAEGRLPQAANEVVISEEIALTSKITYKLGDTLTLNVGQRYMAGSTEDQLPLRQNDSLMMDSGSQVEAIQHTSVKSYTVVGVIKRPTWEPTWAPGYTIISYVDDRMLAADDSVHAFVVLNKVKKSLYSHAEKLASKLEISGVTFNNELLRYYGVTNNDNLNMVLYSLSAIIMSVIIIGSVSLIYNAFAISVSERARHLGMLSSVGATRRQKRNSVFFEGVMIGLISIPLGILSGLAGIGLTFWFINSKMQGVLGVSESLTVTVTPISILVACGVSALTIFISTYIPARKASKISAIDAIRQTTDIKLTDKAVKTTKLVRKLFGIEADIGLKNLKRNKRRYQATVFSLVISIVLFLTVSYFTDSLKKSLDMSQAGINYDIQIWARSGELEESFVKSIASLEEVTEYSGMKEVELNTWIDEAAIAEPLKQYPSELEDGKLPYQVNVYGLDDQSLKAYASKVGADYEELTDPSHMKAIVVDTVNYRDAESGKFVKTKAVHMSVGESISLHTMDGETESRIGEVAIATLTDQQPMGSYSPGLSAMNVIVSNATFEQLMNSVNSDQVNKQTARDRLFLSSSDPMKTQREIEEMNNSNIRIYNEYQSRQQQEQLILLTQLSQSRNRLKHLIK